MRKFGFIASIASALGFGGNKYPTDQKRVFVTSGNKIRAMKFARPVPYLSNHPPRSRQARRSKSHGNK